MPTTVSIAVKLVDIPSDSPSVLEEVRISLTELLQSPAISSAVQEALGKFDPQDVTVTFLSY